MHMITQRTENIQGNCGEKSRSILKDVITLFQDLLYSYSNKTMWFQSKDRHVDQQNRMRSPEIDPYV